MKISDVKPIFTASMEARDSVLMIGAHGIGKTEVVREWSKENDIHLEVLYLSNMETGDLIGIPTIENGITIWTVPCWLDNMNQAAKLGKKCVAFLDEISRAALDVRQAALQLVLDKKIHQHTLPDGTLVIAADNPDNGMYQVEPMDPALLDRFLSLEVEVDAEGWLDWARLNNVNKIVRAYIADNPSKLHFIPDEGSECSIAATPRSWTKLALYVDKFNNTPSELHYQIIKGKIGTALAAQFLSFMKNYQSMISVEDIESLVNELLEKTTSLEDLGDAVKELTEDIEVIQKTELTQSLINKYIKNEAKETFPMMAMIYSLEFETLAGILKKIQNEDNKGYLRIAEIDGILNKKKLFLRLVSTVQ